jgi:glycopeptide antibiotics resistance protein
MMVQCQHIDLQEVAPMEKENPKLTLGVGILFLAYSAMMLWLLFDRVPQNTGLSYWQSVSFNMNLVPLRTIAMYVHILLNTTTPYMLRHAIINLFGNIGMFIPYGIFLPILFPRLQTYWRCWLWAMLGILVVELLQLFTLLGSLDIDDLLLNLIGVTIGYGIFRLAQKLIQKYHTTYKKPRR